MRQIRLVCVAIWLLVLLSVPVAASNITSLYISAAVDLEAECTVNATVELSLDRQTDSLTFPLPEGATGGSVAGYKAKTKNGALVITRDGGFTGTNTFQLSWTVPAAVVDNSSDVDEEGNAQSVIVTIPLQGVGLIWGVQAASFQVSMPANFDADVSVISGYYGTLSAEKYTLEVNGSVISGSISDALLDHEALSIQMTLPAAYFTVERTAGSNTPVGLWSLLAVVMLVGLAELYRRKKLQLRPLEVSLRVQAPENVTAAAVPYLLDGSDGHAAALITQWAGLGYVTIINRGRRRTTFHRRMSMGNERKDYENAMFAAMFAGRDVCQSTEKGFRRACTAMQKPMRRYWRSQVYDEKSGNPRVVRTLVGLSAYAATLAALHGLLPDGNGWLAVAAILGLAGIWLGWQVYLAAIADPYRSGWRPILRGSFCGLILLVLGFFGGAWLVAMAAVGSLCWFGRKTRYGGRRTETGYELLEQLLGLRRFLRTASASRLRALQKKQPLYYFDMLPYAEALGVGRQFSARMPQDRLELPDWLDLDSRRPLTPLEFYTRYHALIASLQTGAAIAAKSANHTQRRNSDERNRTGHRR